MQHGACQWGRSMLHIEQLRVLSVYPLSMNLCRRSMAVPPCEIRAHGRVCRSRPQECLACRGVIFFTGVGKSGFIAQKVSQTLVSTGTKAVFLNPTDALHGDIGIVGPADLLVALSKSGGSEELLRLMPYARVCLLVQHVLHVQPKHRCRLPSTGSCCAYTVGDFGTMMLFHARSYIGVYVLPGVPNNVQNSET